MRILNTLSIFFVLGCALSASAQEQTAEQVKTNLSGEWSVMELTMGERAAPEKVIANSLFNFTGESLVLRGVIGPKKVTCDYTIDPALNPMRISIKPKGQEDWAHGIFKVTDNRVTFRFSQPGHEAAPRDFDSAEDGNRILAVVVQKPEE